MTGKAQAEIQQSRRFESLAIEAGINVWLTAEALRRATEAVLKPAGLSSTQYNVLRILRGAGAAGLACGEIAERMITRDPDITRLLDRLERQGLVRRARSQTDRRVIVTQITRDGRKLLKQLDKPMREAAERGMKTLGPKRLRQLIDLLEETRVESK